MTEGKLVVEGIQSKQQLADPPTKIKAGPIIREWKEKIGMNKAVVSTNSASG